ncbi:MAG: glycosyltransferase, partial [Burkholderiaceae bacterium]|nr:glycosyltransferase [Burkholderiaceae bacterium]
MKATFVITGLATGGAEIMLQKVLERMTRLRVGRVVALRSGGELEDRFRASGFDVVGLDMKPGVPDPRAVWRLAHVLRKDGADVVSTWMYHADIVGGLAARLAGLPVVWSLRNSTLSPDATKLSTRAVVRACAALSHMVPAAIISCSYRARDVHIRLGYKASKFRVIPNGFDIGRFAPSNEARLAVRRELGISDDAPLVGLVARFDPQKNHAGFLEAAQSIHQQRPDVRFVMVGAGVTRDNPALTGDIRDRGLSGVVALLGRREDMPQLMAALDVLVSSSYGEAFPNVLGEACLLYTS